MDLAWDFIAELYKVVTRLADERPGLKEGSNSGWKDKGKGRASLGMQRKNCCTGWILTLPRLKKSRRLSLPTPTSVMCQAAQIR